MRADEKSMTNATPLPSILSETDAQLDARIDPTSPAFDRLLNDVLRDEPQEEPERWDGLS
jgi:hypothetical protein